MPLPPDRSHVETERPHVDSASLDRTDTVDFVSMMAEEGRVRVRSARRDAMDAVKALQKDSAISEDDAKRHEKDVQEETDKHISQINSHLSEKEQELTTV